MCRAHGDHYGHRRCKTREEERVAKANYRARVGLVSQYSASLTQPSEKSAPTHAVTAPELTVEERVTELLRRSNSISEDTRGMSLKDREAHITSIYVELGQIVDKAGRPENFDENLKSIQADAKVRDDEITAIHEERVALHSKITNMRGEVLSSAGRDPSERLSKSDFMSLIDGETKAEYERLVALKDEKAVRFKELVELRAQKNEKLESLYAERREGYLAALKDVGVEFAEDIDVEHDSKNSHKKAVEAISSITKYFPKQWIDSMNKEKSLIIKESARRAHYIEHTLESKYKMVQKVRYLTKPAGWQPNLKDAREKDYINVPVGDYGEAIYVNPATGSKMTVSVNNPTDTVWVAPEYDYYNSYDGSDLPPSDVKKWEEVQVSKPFLNSDTGKWEQRIATGWRKPVRKRTEVEVISSPQLVIPKPNIQSDKHVYGVSNAQSVALHELTHRVESHNPSVVAAERAFIAHRAKLYTPDAEELTEISHGEYGYRDNFTNHYVGRDYEGRNYEVMSVGLEMLWFGKGGGHEKSSTYSADPEFKHFLLGVLASTASKKD